jgi:hypothetical protein
MGPFRLKNKYGVDFRYFRKCRHFENVLFEPAAVDYSRLPIFVLIRFWEIRIKFINIQGTAKVWNKFIKN